MTGLPRPCPRCGAKMAMGTRCTRCRDEGLRMKRPCAECGTATLDGNLCARCKAIARGPSPYDDPEYRRNRPKAMRRAGGRCEMCGHPGTKADPLECDHIVEITAGGTHRLDNLRVAHRSFNLGRRRKPRPRARARAR